MQGDPTGAATAVATDTAVTSSDALTEPTGDGTTVESSGSEVDAQGAPTPGDESAEESGAEEEVETPETRSRKQRQIDAYLKELKADPAKLREALGDETLEPLFADKVAKIEADRKAADEVLQREARTSEAVKARTEKFSKFLGTQESNQALQTEIEQLRVELETLNADPDIAVDQTKHERAVAIASQLREKRGDLTRLAENNQMSDLIWEEIWGTIEGEYASAAQFPELAKDPKLQTRYLKAEGGVKGALSTLRDILRSDWKAESDAEIASVKKSAKAELDAMTQEAKTWRQRAGGEELAGIGSGAPASSGAMTRSQFMGLPQDQKEKMRREQPTLVAEIYARSA